MSDDFEKHVQTLKPLTGSINEAALKGMIKTYALVVSKPDARYIACTDDSERMTVRKNFLQKKLGLSNGEAELDQAVVEVCQKMKDERMKHRVPFYYLLAEKYGKLSIFG